MELKEQISREVENAKYANQHCVGTAERILRLFSVSEQLVHCTDDDHSARRFFGGEKQCGKCGHPLR